MADPEPNMRNEAVEWSEFDAGEYWKTNYATILPEDAEIIACASEFLIEACGEAGRVRRAVDVGAGTNLYPALLMLPWAEHITFTDYASTNVDWLREKLAAGSGAWEWQPFWNLVGALPGYQTVDDPRQALATGHEIREASIFELPAGEWDLGTMFFVADGMTEDKEQFEVAVRAFLRALRPGAPFLMAFMEGSRGYEVSGLRFPSVPVTPRSLEALLARLPVTRARVALRTDNTIQALRPGYDAMLLVTGLVSAEEGEGKVSEEHK
jgi:NNMT/PNMT/TEMT family